MGASSFAWFCCLHAAEAWLGYLAWSLLVEQVSLVFFFSLVQTGFNATSLLYVILAWLLPPLLLIWPALRRLCARWSSVVRGLFLPAAVLCPLLDSPVARAVLASLAVAAHYLASAASLTRDDAEEDAERASQRQRHVFGLVAGPALRCAISCSLASADPLSFGVLSAALLGVLTCAALALVLVHEVRWREVQHDASPEGLLGSSEIARYHEFDCAAEEEFESRVDGGWHEYWLWILFAFCLAGSTVLHFMFFVQPGVANTYSGNGAPYPVSAVACTLMVLGVALAPVLCDTVYPTVILIIGAGLGLHLEGPGGAAGVLLMCFAGPGVYYGVLNSYTRGFPWPALLLGNVVQLLFLVFYLGVDTGAASLIGTSFLGAPFMLAWIAVALSSALCLLVVILRALLTGDTETLVARLFVPKLTLPNLRKLLVCGLLLLVVLVAVGVRSGAVNEAPRVPLRANSFRVATYNVFLGYHAVTGLSNLGDVRQVLYDRGVDLVAMQETDAWDGYSRGSSNPEYTATVLRFPSQLANWGAPSNRGSFGASILSVFPSTNSGWQPLYQDLAACPSCLNRVMVFQDVELEAGFVVRLVNVHLDFVDNATQVRQAREAREYANAFGGPAIVLGDFNAEPGSTTYTDFIQDGWSNAVLEATGSQPRTFERCYAGECQVETLDYVFYKGLSLLDAEVVESSLGVSDHLCVTATFSR